MIGHAAVKEADVSVCLNDAAEDGVDKKETLVVAGLCQ